jgi:sporulation-control protein spo0M
LNMRIFGVDLGELHYAVSYGDSGVVAAKNDPTTRLDDFVQSTARLMGGQVADSQDGTDLGLPANDYLIDVDGVTEMRGHVLATGRRVYNITITGKETTPEDLDRVIYSFAIL